MSIHSLLLAVALALPLPVAATASTIFASEVTTFLEPQSHGSRSIGANALGAADGRFLSLGFGGVAVFAFGQAFTGPAAILEITFGNRDRHIEAARVYVGNVFDTKSKVFDASAFTKIGDIDNTATLSNLAFDGGWAFLAVEDVSPRVNGRDGFDIDAISVSTAPSPVQIAPVPLPASGLLLLGAMAAFLRKRRRRTV